MLKEKETVSDEFCWRLSNLEDGNVITWGLVTGGGDSSAVEAQLRRM